jgi:hypothetical protein
MATSISLASICSWTRLIVASSVLTSIYPSATRNSNSRGVVRNNQPSNSLISILVLANRDDATQQLFHIVVAAVVPNAAAFRRSLAK